MSRSGLKHSSGRRWIPASGLRVGDRIASHYGTREVTDIEHTGQNRVRIWVGDKAIGFYRGQIVTVLRG